MTASRLATLAASNSTVADPRVSSSRRLRRGDIHFTMSPDGFVAEPASADSSSGRRMLPVSACRPAAPALFRHELTDTWDDLAAIQLDVGHEGFVG